MMLLKELLGASLSHRCRVSGYLRASLRKKVVKNGLIQDSVLRLWYSYAFPNEQHQYALLRCC